jgi:hypothetical protein
MPNQHRDGDTEDIARYNADHHRIRDLITTRQSGRTPPGYYWTTAALGLTALTAWFFIIAAMDDPGPMGRGYVTAVAAASVLAVAAVGSIAVTALEITNRRRDARADTIAEYRHARQVKAINDAADILTQTPGGFSHFTQEDWNNLADMFEKNNNSVTPIDRVLRQHSQVNRRS